MCYSAAVQADFKAFQRLFPKVRADIKSFYDIYWRRKKSAKPPLRIPKAVDAMFAHPATDDERAIGALIEEHDAALTRAIEEEMFVQRKRLVTAERALQEKPTKKASEDQRIANKKISDGLAKLEGLRRTDLREGDTRIFPGWMAPVLIIENGEPVVRLMRYQLRPAGKPADFDVRFPGAYNSRFDNLRRFWRHEFGKSHGVLLATAFFENVKRHTAEHRELGPGEPPQNIVLRFEPRPRQEMVIACLYSHWIPAAGSDEPDLWSFSAITDDPPPEVAEAGHDRCIVQLRRDNVLAWLRPEKHSLDQLEAILMDREERPFYEHRLAA